MLTASVVNNNLIIFSDSTITGFNSSYVYVYDSNKLTPYSFISSSSNTINLLLNYSARVGNTLKLRVYAGGITTTNSGVTTTFAAVNNTVYQDANAPSLYELVQQKTYSYTSFIYYNVSSSQGTYPSTSLTLKRSLPTGNITINEGYQGPMNVRRFAAMSSPIFSIPSSSQNSFPVNFAFSYISYGNHTISSVLMSMSSLVGTISSSLYPNPYGYLTLKNDYFSSPGSVVLGVSSYVDLTNLNNSQTFTFSLQQPVTLPQGIYWFVFSPTTNSGLTSNIVLGINTASSSYYSSKTYTSQDGIVYTNAGVAGITVTLYTQNGIVLPSQDLIYNQLDQVQNIPVQYGDSTNLNVFTQIALPITSHYISKTVIDNSQSVYAIEILADNTQGGGNKYALNYSSNTYFSMIANQYTTNIVRYVFTTPFVPSSPFILISQGDYYSANTIGNVLVSAADSVGIAKIELSPTASFPPQSTQTILANGVQQYIQNIPNFNFGNTGGKFNTILSGLSAPCLYLFGVNYNNSVAYLAVSANSIVVVQNGIVVNTILSLSNNIITFATQGVNEFIILTTSGVIYGINSSFVCYIKTNILSNLGVPISAALGNNIVYVGVAQYYDANVVQNRSRIYSLQSSTLFALSWSTNIPEPEITYLYYSTIYGLFVAAYNEQNSNYTGTLYLYTGSNLVSLYSSYFRIDCIYISPYTNTLYLGVSIPSGGYFSGCQVIAATYDTTNNVFNNFSYTGVSIAGQKSTQISSTKINNQIFFASDQSACLFDESNYTVINLQSPPYSVSDSQGLLTTIENNDLGLADYQSSYVGIAYSNINFEPYSAGFGKNFTYKALGQIMFSGATNAGYTTSLYLQYPQSYAYIDTFIVNGKTVTTNPFNVTVTSALSPVEIYLSVKGSNMTGLGTIALFNGINSSGSLVGIQSFVAPKNLSNYFKTGGTYDLFSYSDGSIRQANISDLTSNIYYVYAKFTDVLGNVTPPSNYITDTIYSQKQQQIAGTQTNQGSIYEINPFNKTYVKNTPPSGAKNFIYSGSKVARVSGFYESEPFYASDVTSWGTISVVCTIPSQNDISSSVGITTGSEWGTSVTLYVATSSTLSGLANSFYTQYTVSTIDSSNIYPSQGSNISVDLSALNGQWLQFQLVLTTATQNIQPTVNSVYVTYYGAGNSVLITKTFDTAVQGQFTTPPTIKRAILTSNFVTNGGQVNFYYTTNSSNNNIQSYTQITPNTIFTLPVPASQIKFGVILKSASSFLDDFAVQVDLGQNGNTSNDVYYMPPQAGFAVTAYYDQNGNRVPYGYQFINKTVGIVSSYNWTFGTSYPQGISSYIAVGADIGVATANRTNPIIVFTNPGPFNVGLFVTGFVQNGVLFNSETYFSLVTASVF